MSDSLVCLPQWYHGPMHTYAALGVTPGVLASTRDLPVISRLLLRRVSVDPGLVATPPKPMLDSELQGQGIL